MRATASRVDLRVPRRRVQVTVEMMDSSVHRGQLYADALRFNGTAGRLADRLNDPMESFLPLATDEEHILLRKSRIAVIELPVDEVDVSTLETVVNLELEVRLFGGQKVSGVIQACAVPGFTRVLDLLNRHGDAFLAVLKEDSAALVNVETILAVRELVDRAPLAKCL